MSSLDLWRGEFGDQYTQRQPFLDPMTIWTRLLPDECVDVLEVGCNRGDNMVALDKIGCSVSGIEPNLKACGNALANTAGRRVKIAEAHAGAIPFADGDFDLVFTAGVLIHIHPDHLDRALHEIHRVSRRYILSIEYESWHEEPVEYRGIPDGIWKRDYGQEWMSRYPVNLVKWWPEQDLAGSAFDGCSAWLFDKRPPVASVS